MPDGIDQVKSLIHLTYEFESIYTLTELLHLFSWVH